MSLPRSLAFVALAALSACAPAQISLPRFAVPVSETTISGIGGGRTGSFAIAGHTGSWSRSADRLDVANFLSDRSGSVGFVISGPAISPTIEADCRVRELALTFGDIGFSPAPMSLRCTFTADGRSLPARFELQAVGDGDGSLLSKEARRGQIALDRVVLDIRSTHRLDGVAMETATPVGYVFSDATGPVGAVELTGTPRVWLPDDAPSARAVITAALILSLFWDPAEDVI